MRAFTDLYLRLDATTKRTEKLAALEDYFRSVPPADAAWALYLFSGRRLIRAVSTRKLRTWAAEAANLPAWLIDECYDNVGDLSETLSLIVPFDSDGCDASLAQVIDERIKPLPQLDETEQQKLVMQTWSDFDAPQRFLFHKLISGAFRVGAAEKTVCQALANVAGIDAAVMAHRLMGKWEPTAADFERLCDAASAADDPSQPYPFYLASPLDQELEVLGDVGDWQIEWKWDGIRAQVIKRDGAVFLWSRGEEMINEQFPELVAAARRLPDGTVLDGEVLAWEDGRPLPFHLLQRRLNRKRVEMMLFQDVPVVFMAYDVLERASSDMRDDSLAERSTYLAELADEFDADCMMISDVIECGSWDDVAECKQRARENGTEGVMIKRRDSVYEVGRKKGNWWKFKRDPYTIDAVMTAAQRGHGKRATLYTDYTFGVWQGDELVTIAKAYSGLSDEEIREVDRFVRRHSTERKGPVRLVKPELVFELAFEGIQPSERHKAGVALRFPRMARWRKDKPATEADTLQSVRELLAQVEARR